MGGALRLYGACGTLYAVIGIVAVAAAFGYTSNPKGSRGVLHLLAGLPFGRVLLAGLAIGLAG